MVVALTLNNTIHDTKWTVSTRTSTNMIGNSSMLKTLPRYLSNDVVLIGNGTLHEIAHTSDTIIRSGKSHIKLKDI